MIGLLNNDFAPITFKIGLLNCSYCRAHTAFVEWGKKIYEVVEFEEEDSSLEQKLERLKPLEPVPRQQLMVSTVSDDWVAFFDNGSGGSDPVSTVGYLAQQLACRGLIATAVPNTYKDGKGLYGAVQFELFAPHCTEFLNYERSVFAANDGGRWAFGATGIGQPFEETEQYTNRRIIDRFTPDMLRRYCHALGVYIESHEFYGRQSVLEIRGPLRPRPGGWPSFTLQEMRKSMGLEPDAQ